MTNQAPEKKKFPWRKWNNILHRDIGYLCVGLTIIYAVSGIAVNHVSDWNPSYSKEIIEKNLGAISDNGEIGDNGIKSILRQMGEPEEYKSTFFEDEETLMIFADQNTVTVNLQSGDVTMEKISSRPLLKEFNFLHYNYARKLWTYVADLYAFSLFLLAITGLFVIKGKKGIKGRGAWMTAIGIVIPIVFLIYYL